MIPSIEYNYFLWFAKYKNIFPSFFWIKILKIVIFSLFGKFRSRSWIDSWQNFKNYSFMFLCVLLCFVHDMDTIWIDLIKSRSLNSVDLSLPFKWGSDRFLASNFVSFQYFLDRIDILEAHNRELTFGRKLLTDLKNIENSQT